MKPVDLKGKKFNMLTAIEPVGRDKHGKVVWLFKCECGNTRAFTGTNVSHGNVKNCGCIHGNKRYLNYDHNANRRIYTIWNDIKRRCFEPNRRGYERYGGKGVTICEEWLDFQNFFDWSMENGYADDLSIDRIDSNGNYEPNNCRWVDIYVQANNRSNNHLITYNGKTQSMMMWSRELGIPYNRLRARLQRGWDVERALGVV